MFNKKTVLNFFSCSIFRRENNKWLVLGSRMNSSLGRTNCINPISQGPKCSKENLAKKTKCKDAAPKTEEKTEQSHFKSMWENPACCLDPCPDVLPRFDALYWKVSDKGKRKYVQTWAECPKIKIAPKKLCCFDEIKLPPLPKRSKELCPKTACGQPGCKLEKDGKCRKVNSPCCKAARDPPNCYKSTPPKKCKKVCAPYPCFSECSKDAACPLHPVECKCLLLPSLCEVYEEMRRQHLFKS